MVDCRGMTVEEIREKLSQVTGRPIEEFQSIKGKSNLSKLLNEEIGENPFFGEIEEETTEVLPVAYPGESVSSEPKLGSPEWQEYVLSHLTDDEVIVKDGIRYPKSVGLRRVSQILLGPIVKSGPEQVFPPTGPKNLSTVVYGVHFLWTYECPGFRNGFISEAELLKTEFSVRSFTEVADCSIDNTAEKYAVHSTATAATRAEGRALRKALQLNVLTADEVSAGLEEIKTISNTEDVDLYKQPISELQKISIASICKRLKINVDKFLEFNSIESLEKCSNGKATDLMKILATYQTTSNDKVIPPDYILEATLA